MSSIPKGNQTRASLRKVAKRLLKRKRPPKRRKPPKKRIPPKRRIVPKRRIPL